MSRRSRRTHRRETEIGIEPQFERVAVDNELGPEAVDDAITVDSFQPGIAGNLLSTHYGDARMS